MLNQLIKKVLLEATSDSSGGRGAYVSPLQPGVRKFSKKSLQPFTTPVSKYINAELEHDSYDGKMSTPKNKIKKMENKAKKISNYIKNHPMSTFSDEDGNVINQTPGGKKNIVPITTLKEWIEIKKDTVVVGEKKVIKLNESDILRMVKRILSEQDDEKTYYKLGATGLGFKIIDGKLYTVLFDRTTGEVTPKYALNGELYDFKVNVNTGEVLDEDYLTNIELTDNYWSDIVRSQVQPMQYNNVRYKFIAVAPEGSPYKAAIGLPTVYTGDIGSEDISVLKSMGMTESKDTTISPMMYYKKRGKGYYIRLYPGARPGTKITSGGTPKKTTQSPVNINLDITEPFVFDKTELTPDAQIKIDKFITDLSTNLKKYPKYGEFLLQNVPLVVAYSSRDKDPNDTVIGKLPACQSSKTRGDYNLCLSKQRAITIAKMIKEKTGVDMNPIGKGETTEFGSGWTKEKPTTNKETQPNRRFSIKIKDYTE
jgi:outer membrane protein OmpA-like peptidoglycan-associated protein